MYVCTYVCTCVCMRAYMRACICTIMYVCTHVHTGNGKVIHGHNSISSCMYEEMGLDRIHYACMTVCCAYVCM